MKTPFLLCWLCPLLLNAQSHAISLKPSHVFVRNNYLFDLMANELTPKNLRIVYGRSFRVQQITKNIHNPALRDTVLAVNTSTDKLKVFKNKYATHLISATLTSNRLAFGHGIRIGATKGTFCKVFGLSSKYDEYEIAIYPEASESISFLFKKDILAEVNYQILYDLD